MLRHPAFAALAALVWLLGVEVGPGLHIALHAQLGHHHHGTGEALGCASHEDEEQERRTPHAAAGHHEHHAASGHHEHHAAAGHHEHHAAAGHHDHHAAPKHHEHHAAPKHHEHHAAPDDAPPPAAPEADRPVDAHAAGSAVPHGTGSLAHRDLVPLTPLPVLPPILSAPWRPLEITAVASVTPRDRTPDVLRARGPPIGRSTPEPSSVV